MKVLITGGSGLVGKKLTEALLLKGHEVAHFSRSARPTTKVKTFVWNIDTQTLDKEGVIWADVIVHLAGAGIADKRWSEARKKELIASRVVPIKMIEQVLIAEKHTLNAFISASGIGFYGADTGENQNDENTVSGHDFLAECTKKWEAAVENLGHVTQTRIAKLRTSVVLSIDGGALPKLLMPIKYWIGSPLGNGQQWFSWIHEADLVMLFCNAIENNDFPETMNAVASETIRNKDLVKSIAKTIERPLWAPAVPSFILRILLGEMAQTVLGSSKNTSKYKPIFKLKYENLDEALQDLLKK